MALFINEQCTACDICRPECPTGSIFPGKVRYLIDADSCRDCKLCAKICPVNAIHALPSLAVKIKPLAEEEE